MGAVLASGPIREPRLGLVMRFAVGFRNGIGNLILLTPALQLLTKFSGSQVDIILDENWKDRGAVELMIQNYPFVRKIVNYSEHEAKKYKGIYASRHTIITDPLAIQLRGDPHLQDIEIPNWRQTRFHERDHYLMEIRDQFGCSGPIPPLFISTQHYPLPPGPKICFVNGWLRNKTGRWKRKSYPYWGEVISAVKKLYPSIKIYILGGEEDNEYWDDQKLGEIPKLCGKTNILQTASIIEQCDFGLYNDTGSFHIADALKKPGIVLFGSTLVSKNGPLNGTIKVIRSNLNCAPCQYTVQSLVCNRIEKCMKAIDPGQVIALFRKMFRIG
jgi:hypothetical protein